MLSEFGYMFTLHEKKWTCKAISISRTKEIKRDLFPTTKSNKKDQPFRLHAEMLATKNVHTKYGLLLLSSSSFSLFYIRSLYMYLYFHIGVHRIYILSLLFYISSPLITFNNRFICWINFFFLFCVLFLFFSFIFDPPYFHMQSKCLYSGVALCILQSIGVPWLVYLLEWSMI